MEDARAKFKSIIRKSRPLSVILQWVFDPAYTPVHSINNWVKGQKGLILNFGSGSRNFTKNVINLDCENLANVHVVNKSREVPFREQSFDAVLLEYVLEHVEKPYELLKEVQRVLRPGAEVCATVPFRQNYHACPHDYWRFTHEGLKELFAQIGFKNIRVTVYGGPVSAWIDATKEFLATILCFRIPILYDVLSQVLIVPFIPLRYLDIIFRKWPVAKYTAFSFQILAQKEGVRESYSSAGPAPIVLEELLRVPEEFQAVKREKVYWIENREYAITKI